MRGLLGPLLALSCAAAAAAASGRWTIVPTPNKGSFSNGFNAVAVSPEGDAWAVGHWYDNSLASYRTFTARWSGAQWGSVASPNSGSGYNDLQGVSALSSGDAWAVGYSRATQYSSMRTLLLHWTAGAWRVVPGPNPGPSDNVLYAVQALAANDVWAAGWFYDAQHHGQPLLLHWNGAQWSQVAAPAASATYNVLQGLSASGPDDVWAVGRAYQSGKYATLAMHWDGAAWSVVPSPSVAGRSNQLRSVAAIAPDDAWAVGDAQGIALLQHWDGTSWTQVAGGEPTTTYNTLWGISARASTAAWAVGYSRDAEGNVVPLVEQWNGWRWSAQALPPAGMMPVLFGVAGAPYGTLWAVGLQSNGSADRTLALRALQ